MKVTLHLIELRALYVSMSQVHYESLITTIPFNLVFMDPPYRFVVDWFPPTSITCSWSLDIDHRVNCVIKKL